MIRESTLLDQDPVPSLSEGSLHLNGNIGVSFSNASLEKRCESFLFGSLTFSQEPSSGLFLCTA